MLRHANQTRQRYQEVLTRHHEAEQRKKEARASGTDVDFAAARTECDQVEEELRALEQAAPSYFCVGCKKTEEGTPAVMLPALTHVRRTDGTLAIRNEEFYYCWCDDCCTPLHDAFKETVGETEYDIIVNNRLIRSEEPSLEQTSE